MERLAAAAMAVELEEEVGDGAAASRRRLACSEGIIMARMGGRGAEQGKLGTLELASAKPETETRKTASLMKESRVQEALGGRRAEGERSAPTRVWCKSGK